jgi:hypothetical protein
MGRWVGVWVLVLAVAAGAEPVAARRVVSLNPSLTAMVIALGGREQLVGVDDYSARTPAAAGLPTVGGLYNPSLEAVVALAPDLVVLVPSAEQRAFRERLEALGIARPSGSRPSGSRASPSIPSASRRCWTRSTSSAAPSGASEPRRGASPRFARHASASR